MEELDDVSPFPYVDARGASEVDKMVTKCDDPGLKLRFKQEKRTAQRGTRQRLQLSHYLFIIIDERRHRDLGESLYRLNDLMNCKPRNKHGHEDRKRLTLGDINRWIHEWDEVMLEMDEVPNEEGLYTIFVDQSGITQAEVLAFEVKSAVDATGRTPYLAQFFTTLFIVESYLLDQIHHTRA